MTRNFIYTGITFLFSLIIALPSEADSRKVNHYILTTDLNRSSLKYMPVTDDNRNYFMLQSIDNTTKIIIGDFSSSDKTITMIVDEGSDGTLDQVIEYYPERNKFREPTRPSTRFFTDLDALKKQIINGTIYESTYTYKMYSLDDLKKIIKRGEDVVKKGRGWSALLYDQDDFSTIMGSFFFGKKYDRYNLVFSTRYYKIKNFKVIPPVYFSVYCKNSDDPLIRETVESLLKMIVK